MKVSVITTYDQSALSVTLAEAKARLRIDTSRTDFDTDITRLIKVATQWLERRYGIAIMKQVRQQRMDCFEYKLPYSAIGLLYPPVRSVDSFSYTKEDGTNGTLTLDTDFKTAGMMAATVGAQDIIPASVYPVTSWPSYKMIKEAVLINYTCGYSDDDTKVPQNIREAILRLLVFLFENPMDEITDQSISKFEMNVAGLMSTYEQFSHVSGQEWPFFYPQNYPSYAY